MKSPGNVALVVGFILAGAWCTSNAVAQHRTPPTTPPCYAEGVCRPAPKWGIQTTKWRQWPGTVGAPTMQPTPVGDRGNPLGDFQAPPPKDEDREAPPMIEAIEPETEQPRGADDVVLPDFETPQPEGEAPERPQPERPAGEGLPFGNPIAPPGVGGGAGRELPPSLPFGDGPPGPAITPAPPTPTPEPFQFNQVLPPLQGDDAPPALPLQLGGATVPAATAPPASRPAQRPLTPRPASAVRPASAHSDNLPPALPAIFFGD